ncbi:uncharacterized protein LAESUDRAFT_404420 [Laetiporus sulphureus 93-53]|uniref:Uncharacterized protein n=1 Tax=Laetiporus sulphureus 93-53 TaxID=1314785 RepID=A0A165CCZ6_9APHY|nr:uncharacterized protein LAESUDRAFT_404420 [Laetiporus sulphureus 93-53]KZT02587.1 hypothetical protein LAESUDRAFT_404420 [Laetiporus sulphureus 93-53]
MYNVYMCDHSLLIWGLFGTLSLALPFDMLSHSSDEQSLIPIQDGGCHQLVPSSPLICEFCIKFSTTGRKCILHCCGISRRAQPPLCCRSPAQINGQAL